MLPPKNLAPTSFFKVPPEKRPGTTRVGVFGCSFVAGDEVAPGQDVPTLLQERFRRAGRRDVEIVNFGVSGYGMHQAYLLWRFLGRRYGLDTTVFMPFEFHETRETTFLMDGQSYGPIHSRFIMRDGRLELVAAEGASNRERSDLYYRAVPLWRYLRYDEKPPALLRSLLPDSRRWPKNPFYYWHDGRDEVFATYVAIFKDLAASAKNLVVVSDGHGALATRLGAAVGDEKALFHQSTLWDFTARNRDLYYEPFGHMSALANAARADELYALLAGRPSVTLDLPALAPADWTSSRRPRPALPLDRAAAVSLRAAGKPAAVFVYYDPGCLGCKTGLEPDFKRDGVESLVVEDAPDRRLIGLRRPLIDGERLFVRSSSGAATPVGVVRSPDGVVGRMVFDGGMPAAASGLTLRTPSGPVLDARAAPARGFEWLPAQAPYYLYARAAEDGGPSPAADRAARSLDLAVLRPDGAVESRPLFALARRRVTIQFPARASRVYGPTDESGRMRPARLAAAADDRTSAKPMLSRSK